MKSEVLQNRKARIEMRLDACATGHCDLRIVRKEQAYVARESVFQEVSLLIDQALRKAVVAHRHWHMDPRSSRNQVSAEHNVSFASDFAQHQAWRMSIGQIKVHHVPQARRARRRRLAEQRLRGAEFN